MPLPCSVQTNPALTPGRAARALQGATAFVSDDHDFESEDDVREMYHEMGDFVVEDDEEEEEDPTVPDYDSAVDGSSTLS